MSRFDDLEALSRKIRLGEDSLLELKQVAFRGRRVAAPRRRELADELAAFANTRGGAVLLGVDDRRREVVGMSIEELDQLETWVREISNDSIEPPLLAHIERLELPGADGRPRPLLGVEVPQSLFVHKSPGGYFHRLGSSKREMRPELLARLFQERTQTRVIRFDEQPVPDTGLENLEERLWRRFLGPLAEDSRMTLRKLGLLTDDGFGVERASVAGVLLAAPHPETYLPGATIEAARYRGVEQDPRHQTDARRITGPLDQQIHDAMAFFRRNMTVAATKDPARRDYPQFSEQAAFEAIVNAVAHRDYSIYGSKIRLFMFDDRLEIYSPGGLPNTLTVESLALRQATRNELVASLLGRAPAEEDGERVGRRHFIEKRGDGVPIILRESRELSGREPVYRLIDDSELMLTIFSAELPNRPGSAA
jgi:predicted HTH transcriptional regulator